MKKILIVLGGLVALLVLAVVVGPGLIDWNQYKAELGRQAERYTGRGLIIDGDLEVSLLPAPALIAHDVRLANVPGAGATDMVDLDSLQVRVALAPLLSGRVKVQTVHLVNPVIELERFADGRTNLEFSRPEKPAASTEPSSPQSPTASGGSSTKKKEEAFSLDNFVVENGTVIFRDAVSGTVESVEHLNASFAAASLAGPFESSGDLIVRGFPMDYAISVGRIIEQRTVPVSLTLGLRPDDLKATFSGAIVGMDETPMFKGLVKATGPNLARLLQAIGSRAALPGFLGQPFGLEGEVEAAAGGANVANLTVSLERTVAKGSASVVLKDTPSASLDLAVESIDLDKWMAMAQVPRAVVSQPISKQAKKADDAPNASVSIAIPDKVRDNAGDDGPLTLPAGMEAALSLKADSLTLNGGLVRQARLNAELVGGEITLHQLSAQLPGTADVALFGFVIPGEGGPGFEGELEAVVGDLRGVLGWLGMDPPPVPADRLRKMTLSSKLSAAGRNLTLSGLDLQFDSSRLTGRSVLRLGATPGLDADLVLDRINLDAYLRPAAARKQKPAAPADGNPGPDTPASTDPQQAGRAEGNRFAALRGLDADVKGRIKTLVYGGAQIKNVAVDASLKDTVLNLRRFSIDKVAGSSFQASGTVANLAGIPDMKGVRIQAKSRDLPRLLRLAGADVPAGVKKLGPVSLDGQIDGSALNPRIDLRLKGAGGRLGAAGKVSFLPLVGGFTGRVEGVHKDLKALLRALGGGYRPAGPMGGLELGGQVKADLSGVSVKDLAGRLGPVRLKGGGQVLLAGPRTKIVADLDAGDIDVAAFLPVSENAFMSNPAGPLPAAWMVPAVPGAKPGFKRLAAVSTDRWSREPLDLSALKSVDADIKLRAEALIYGNYTIDKADLAVRLDGGRLRLDRFAGGLFGGAVKASGSVAATAPPVLDTTLSLQNLDVAKGLLAAIEESPASGRGGLELTLKTSGFTVSDMIAALEGRGGLSLAGLDVRKGAGKGTPLSAALGLVASLNSLSTLGRDKGRTDIGGSFEMRQGVARSNDLALSSGLGKGRASGSVDLPRWLIDVDGQVALSENVLGLIVNKGKPVSATLPFSVRGDLDAPRVKLDMSGLQGGGLVIPGLDKALKKKGVGTLLETILPGLGGTGGNGGEQPKPEKLDAEDLLKGLLKGLGN